MCILFETNRSSLIYDFVDVKLCDCFSVLNTVEMRELCHKIGISRWICIRIIVGFVQTSMAMVVCTHLRYFCGSLLFVLIQKMLLPHLCNIEASVSMMIM